MPNQPKSANEVLASTREDHNWKHDPAELQSTGGIQRSITAQWAAIQALADYIDGLATGQTDTAGNPIPSEPRRTFESRFDDEGVIRDDRYEAHRSIGESPPVVHRDPNEQAPAV